MGNLNLFGTKMSKHAVCIMTPDGNSGVEGIVAFTQENKDSKCTITAKITGLTPGLHGFHIHEFGDLTNGCTTAGGHYNPYGKNHGGPDDEERHVGDMGNAVAGEDGVATFTLHDHLISLFGEHNVIGRACVVHRDE